MDRVEEDAEQFDLCDPDGQLTGEVRPRAEVHRLGKWHRAFHCWVVVPGGPSSPRLLFQRRSAHKSTWPGRWDVSVGGHYLAGEGLEGGLREMQEELGIELRADELICVGRRREQVDHDNGLIEREVQDEYMVLAELTLSDLHPDSREVEAIALAPTRDLRALLAGERRTLRFDGGDVLEEGLVVPGKVHLAPAQLVPRADDYYLKVIAAAERLAAGDRTSSPDAWWSGGT